MSRPGLVVLTFRSLLVTALVAGFAPGKSRAQGAASVKLDLSSEGTVQAGKAKPDHKTTSDDPLSLDLSGGETDACFPGDGRPSFAQASGEKKIVMQSEDRVVVELSSRSYARGGHIRKCGSCPTPNTCLFISGEDTSATAKATSDANLNISINSPLKRFRYDLFVGHVDREGKLSVSVTSADGKPLAEMKDRPFHFLVTEANREVFVRAQAATEATDKGNCCDSTDTRKGVLTVSLEPAAEIDANYAFKPFINGGKSTLGYPYVVALGLNGRITCTGTYVGGHSIITAAHCVFPVRNSFRAHKLDVRFGSRFEAPDQVFAVDAVEIPSDSAAGFFFNPKTFEDDIALVTFKGDATVKAADLYAGDPTWSNIVEKKLPVQIVGFGFNVIDGGMVGIGYKREASIHVDSFENRKIFFGAQAANTCDGDSGGPMFVETPDGKSLLLAGVTSGGDDNCKYGVDMRLDAFAGWIRPRIK
jgi:secreted trypsin-like serine protease